MSNVEHVENNLPLTETTYFIMLILSNGPRHGYAIMNAMPAAACAKYTA
jgi:DNA-binding PadR family transcriptional regulator